MKKSLKVLGIFLFFMSIILFAIPLAGFSINGAVIGVSEEISPDYFILAGAIVLLFSVMMLGSKQNLEAIVVPTGEKQDNTKRAKQAVQKYQQAPHDEKPYLFITGKLTKDALGKIKPNAEVREIYTILRQAGIKPSEMILESKSENTLENFMYSLEKFKEKGIKEIQVATSPIHYQRFKLFEQQAKKQGLLDKSFKMIPIYTEQTLYDTIYGIAAYAKDFIKTKLNNPFKKEE